MTPRRLAAMGSWRQEALIDWGYVACDAALRKHAADPLKQDFEIQVASAAKLKP